MSQNEANIRSTLGLLSGALVWGLMWYPLRIFSGWGIDGPFASAIIYGLGIFLPITFTTFTWKVLRTNAVLLLAIGLASGATNLGFIMAVIHGQVMRVVLLFYLAPLWTVLFSKMFLREALRPAGYVLMVIAIIGAAFMLWRPELGMPLPENSSEWLALVSGILFALMNVLSRKAAYLDFSLRSSIVCAGVFVIGMLVFLVEGEPLKLAVPFQGWFLVVIVGILVSVSNLFVQYGLTYTSANRAVLIFLIELIVAGLSSWLLAGEVMNAREWFGGGCIVFAGIMASIIPLNQPLNALEKNSLD